MYDHYPTLMELIRHRGQPGLTYLLTSPERIYEFQKEGYTIHPGVNAMEIKGPRGVASALLLVKGTPILEGNQEASISMLMIDTKLDSVTGFAPMNMAAGAQLPREKEKARGKEVLAQAAETTA